MYLTLSYLLIIHYSGSFILNKYICINIINRVLLESLSLCQIFFFLIFDWSFVRSTWFSLNIGLGKIFLAQNNRWHPSRGQILWMCRITYEWDICNFPSILARMSPVTYPTGQLILYLLLIPTQTIPPTEIERWNRLTFDCWIRRPEILWSKSIY